MVERTLKCVLVALVVGAAMPLNVRGEPTAEKDIQFPRTGEKKDSVCVSCGDRSILGYRRVGAAMKPYVDRLFSPAGVQVLRDSPHDHKHHHGLMFATAVDGVDFWSETPQCGRQKERSLETSDRLELRPDGHWYPCCGLAGDLDWISPASNKPLLVECREVCVLRDAFPESPGFGATLIEWHSRLRRPPARRPPS